MIEDAYNISLRLSSVSFDFGFLIPEINDYKVVYCRKDSSRFKDNTFKAIANVLCVNDIFSCNVIDNLREGNLSDAIIINKLTPLIKNLSVINANDLKRELCISGTIENDQFGFGISHDLMFLLAENGYSLSFFGLVSK